MRFEDLKVWQRATKLCVEVYRHTQDLCDQSFLNQIRRSALSVPSNIAEGWERDSAKETRYFLCVARGSAGELRTQIYIGMKLGFFEANPANTWLQECVEISSMLTGLIKRDHYAPTTAPGNPQTLTQAVREDSADYEKFPLDFPWEPSDL